MKEYWIDLCLLKRMLEFTKRESQQQTLTCDTQRYIYSPRGKCTNCNNLMLLSVCNWSCCAGNLFLE